MSERQGRKRGREPPRPSPVKDRGAMKESERAKSTAESLCSWRRGEVRRKTEEGREGGLEN